MSYGKFWAAAVTFSSTSKTSLKHLQKQITNFGMITPVQTLDDLQIINLSEPSVCQLHQMFKCVQCCSNEHALPSFPLMKNWIINKKKGQMLPLIHLFLQCLFLHCQV